MRVSDLLVLLVQVTSLEPLRPKHDFSYENCSDNAVSVIYCSSYLRCLGMLFVLGCVGPSAVARTQRALTVWPRKSCAARAATATAACAALLVAHC